MAIKVQDVVRRLEQEGWVLARLNIPNHTIGPVHVFDFAPGDGTSYRVLFGRLPPAQWFMKRLLPVLVLLGVVASGFFSGVALAADYLGSGKFASGNLNWCHTSEAVYNTPNQNAVAKWSATTDLNLYPNCTNYQIRTSTPNWGDNGNYGYAFICMSGWMGNYCNSGFGDTYTSCNAQSNRFYLDSWNDTERQFNATHELGHCWSLDHRQSDTTSVMQQGKRSITNPNSTDVNLVNARY